MQLGFSIRYQLWEQQFIFCLKNVINLKYCKIQINNRYCLKYLYYVKFAIFLFFFAVFMTWHFKFNKQIYLSRSIFNIFWFFKKERQVFLKFSICTITHGLPKCKEWDTKLVLSLHRCISTDLSVLCSLKFIQRF